MRGLLIGAAVVALGMGNLAWAGDSTAKEKKGGNWFTRLFGQGGQEAQKKDAPKEPQTKTQGQVPTMAESPEVQRARELAAWRRRVEVCDKLRELALIHNDDDLLRKADQLDQRAWNTYLQRTASLPGSPGNVAKDEQDLQRLLGMEANQQQREAGLLRSRRPADGRATTWRKSHE